jgi:hypothetical protein
LIQTLETQGRKYNHFLKEIIFETHYWNNISVNDQHVLN